MLSDSYGSLEWYRNLSEADKAYASTYGRDALIQKHKREAEAQQQQEQNQVEEPIEEEQVEESEPIDEIAEQKKRILTKIEQKIDLEDELSDLLSDSQWRDVFANFVIAVNAVANGECGYFVQVVTSNGEGKVNVTRKFVDKDGKEIKPITVFSRMQAELYLGKAEGNE